MQYKEFLAHLRQHGGPQDDDQADAAVKVVLATLGQRLAGNEPHDLAAQLPTELKQPLLQHNGEAEVIDDVDDFLRRVADREGPGTTPERAREHARAVFATLAGFVSAGEIDDLRAQLPAGYAALLP
ncbi:hypothetical protein GCM10027271_04010 [Saccharopolyspora gloriosae]|uniref:Uncharacterized protein (DUF2267 family) n=1 Tax=Saccharopolyspora gloriosae TaxID=455344 RepID=A0A840NLJ9_9PSEU|nr:DUF2267 domain-containing protein [Saccharopolyspora gloriosae]MBB5071951.1 uncharacterized protein (DUF2267 family) [Saccharopolyspora gloriosae]